MNIKTETTLPIIRLMNFEEVKKNIIAITSKYDGLVVTEGTLKSCARDQKDLASLRIEIDNERKKIKKIMQSPILQFEEKCKELIQLVLDAEKPIKAGLDVFEQKRKDDKLELINEILGEMLKEAGLPEEAKEQIVIHDRMLNKTVSHQEWEGSLLTQIHTVVEKEIQAKNNKIAVEKHIEDMNFSFDLKSPMKLEDFAYYYRDGFAEITSLLGAITSRAKSISDSQKKAVEEAKKETVVEAPIEKLTPTLDTPRPEPQTDWQAICLLMAKDLSEYFDLSTDEVIKKYVNEYKENQW